MKLSYDKISKEVQDIDDIGFILFNEKGFFTNFNKPSSRYEGWFDISSKIKSLARIRLGRKIISLKRGVNFIEREYTDNSDRIIFGKGMIYEVKKEDKIEVYLDFKRIFDNDEMGRQYDISLKGDLMSVSFEKGEIREDIKIRGVKSIMDHGWVKESYDLDAHRKSPPFERWVYKVIIRGKKLIIGEVSNDKKIYLNSENENILAFDCAKTTLSGMTGKNGISAGFPWFFQVWSRDELISLRALLIMGEKKKFKDIIFRNISLITEEGLLRSNPHSDLKSIDGVFWLFKRIDEGLRLGIFDEKDTHKIKESVVEVINLLEDSRMRYPFVYSRPLESWIDTSYGNDNRGGRLVELQAGMALLYDLAHRLTKESAYSRLLDEIKFTFRKEFFDGMTLKDNLDDNRIRPNLFLAYYLFSDLLDERDWRVAFNNALMHLWLGWGGLSSISKEDPLFTSEYTGEDNKSYHRGDSWFWINNIAAIAMHKIKGFKEEVDKIFLASKEELLWRGCAGSSAELSSAKELRSEGCFVQAWSNAAFIELCYELDLIPLHRAE